MKVKETETLMSTQFVNFNATEFEDKEGKSKFWCWAQRPNAQKAVMIVAYVNMGYKEFNKGYHKDLRLVLTKEFRIPINGYEWGFPAGLIDGEEPLVKAANRELKEETGLTVKRVISQSPFVYNTAGLTDESISIIFVEAEGVVSNEGNESTEDIETFLYTKEQVAELLADTSKKIAAKAWLIMDSFVNGCHFT